MRIRIRWSHSCRRQIWYHSPSYAERGDLSTWPWSCITPSAGSVTWRVPPRPWPPHLAMVAVRCTSSTRPKQHWHVHGMEQSHWRGRSEVKRKTTPSPACQVPAWLPDRGRACFVPQHLIDVLPRKIMKMPLSVQLRASHNHNPSEVALIPCFKLVCWSRHNRKKEVPQYRTLSQKPTRR